MSYKQIAKLHESEISAVNIALLTGRPVSEVQLICDNIDLEQRMAGMGFERFIERDKGLKERGKVAETASMMDFVYRTIKPLGERIKEYLEANPRSMESKMLQKYDPMALALSAIRVVIWTSTKQSDQLKYSTLAILVMTKLTVDIEPDIAVKCGRIVLECMLETHPDFFEKVLERDNTPPYHNVYVIRMTDEFYKWEADKTLELAELAIMFRPMIVPPQPWDGLQTGGYHSENLKRPFIRNRRKLPLSVYGPKVIPKVYEAVNRIQATPFKVNTFVLDTALALMEIAEERPEEVAHRKFIQLEPEPPHTRYAKDLRDDIQKDMEFLGLTSEAFNEAAELDLYNEDGKKKPKKDRITFGRWVRELIAKVTGSERLAAKLRLEKNRFDLIQLLKYKRELTSVKSKNRVIRTAIAAAIDYRDYDEIYFPHNIDYRGRIYPMTAGLTTQGVGLQKALIKFAHGKPIGTPEALDYLLVHTANCWGLDKKPWADRLAWTKGNEDLIKRVAADPVGTYQEWKDADTPWLFIAACQCMVAYYEHGLDAVVDIPIPVDGTCNGAQHYAAMTRDTQGAYGVNVGPNGTKGLRERLTGLRANLSKSDTV